MNPGRELDALVAEKVMGHTVFRNERGGWSLGKPHYYDDHGSSELFNPLPEYSTDIAAAWEIIEKLRDTRHFHLSDSDDGSEWIAEFIYGGPNGYGRASTAPHAICLAALEALKQP